MTANDTSPEADRVLTAVFRRMPAAQKWQQLGATFETARLLHAAGCRTRDPGTSAADIHADWLRTHYGWSGTVTEADITPGGNLRVLREVIAAFDAMGIASALGGSMASSIHGISRFTQDADITVEPFAGKETQ